MAPGVAWIDGGKAIASQLIVWHHLLIYGPMADGLQAWAPDLADWLRHQALLAVQVFLVIGGYLAARSLWPSSSQPRVTGSDWLRRVVARVRRLMPTYLTALGLAIVAAALARAISPHPDTPAAPELWQWLAHVLLLQDLLEVPALSAGIWYVAIDLQLYLLLASLAAVVASLGVGRIRAGRRSLLAWLTVGGLCVASLLYLNLDPSLDVWAPYFFGAYGLGVITHWLSRLQRPTVSGLALAALTVLSLWLEWRGRIALAGLCALALLWQPGAHRLASWPGRALLAWMSRISYPLFLVHYPVSLLIGAVFDRWVPSDPGADTVGLVLTWLASLAMADLMWRLFEAPRQAPLPLVLRAS